MAAAEFIATIEGLPGYGGSFRETTGSAVIYWAGEAPTQVTHGVAGLRDSGVEIRLEQARYTEEELLGACRAVLAWEDLDVRMAAIAPHGPGLVVEIDGPVSDDLVDTMRARAREQHLPPVLGVSQFEGGEGGDAVWKLTRDQARELNLPDALPEARDHG